MADHAARSDTGHDRSTGPAAADLSDERLLHELEQIHASRFTTLRHGSQDALTAHTHRQAALEQEYLRRYPEREVDPQRLREGARAR
jgi:hypothetical protein